MRRLLLFSFVLNLLLTGVSLVGSPDPVAIHFGPGGQPDGFAPPLVNALLMTGMHGMLFGMIYFSPWLIRRTPQAWINLPNKAYWFSDANREQTIEVLCREMYRFGVATMLFLFVVGLLVFDANRSEPVRLKEELFWWPLGLYMGYTVYWTVKIVLMFRKPLEPDGGTG